MFGTIICNTKELSNEERKRYQSVYCGLCRAIKDNYGQLERFTLNYDMTFLAILLNGLYEENNSHHSVYCPVRPFHKREIFENPYIDYAADMTILLSYYKCMDDWEDEKRRTRKLYGNLLEKRLENLKKKYPRQTKVVRESLEQLVLLEKAVEPDIDGIVNYSGKMLAEIFVYQEDFWSPALRRIGFELGRFVYLMDAALDYKRDKKKNTFNPLIFMNKEPLELEPYLELSIGAASKEFEKLPVIQDAEILRNILYGGVWQQYYAKVKRKEDDNGK